jgi:hypothetical protein
MKRDVGDHDDMFSEKKRALNQPGGLVVQQVMPPPGRDNLRQDDRNLGVGVLALHPIDVLDEGPED